MITNQTTESQPLSNANFIIIKNHFYCTYYEKKVLMKRYKSRYKPKFHLARHVMSQHFTTRSTCPAHAFGLCRACRAARLNVLDTTSLTRRARKAQHVECVEPTHFGFVKLVEQHGSTRRARQAQHVECVESMHYGCVKVVEQHCSTRMSRHVERVASCRDVTREAKWNLGYTDCETDIDKRNLIITVTFNAEEFPL